MTVNIPIIQIPDHIGPGEYYYYRFVFVVQDGPEEKRLESDTYNRYHGDRQSAIDRAKKLARLISAMRSVFVLSVEISTYINGDAK